MNKVDMLQHFATDELEWELRRREENGVQVQLLADRRELVAKVEQLEARLARQYNAEAASRVYGGEVPVAEWSGNGCVYCERDNCDTDCYACSRMHGDGRNTAAVWRAIGAQAALAAKHEEKP